ncbi:MAG: hypothetical protein AAFR61_27015 [Bacteroidota bacterium]
MRTICIGLLCMGLLSACGAGSQITERGLKYVKLGDPMPEAGLNRWKGHAVTDTLFDEGGFSWRGMVLKYREGQVLIEEDFLKQGTVNRIRVESPQLNVKKTIAVGNTVADLLPLAKDWDVLYLADYGLLDVTSLSDYHIHFLIRDTENKQELFEKEGLKLQELSPSAQIVSIVIM